MIKKKTERGDFSPSLFLYRFQLKIQTLKVCFNDAQIHYSTMLSNNQYC
ncbi:MAG: hypothetical protein U0354_20920 [Candidatus Sericytochromatia bacterium]